MTIEDSWGGDVTTAAIAHLAHSTPTGAALHVHGLQQLRHGLDRRGRAAAAERPHGGVDGPGPRRDAAGGVPEEGGGRCVLSGRTVTIVRLMSHRLRFLPAEVQALVDQRSSTPSRALDEENGGRRRRPPFFFGVAAAVKKKGGGAPALELAALARRFHDVGDGRPRGSEVLLEIARMSPTDAEVRKELTAALKARFAGHPALAAVLAKFPLEKARGPLRGRRPHRALAALSSQTPSTSCRDAARDVSSR